MTCTDVCVGMKPPTEADFVFCFIVGFSCLLGTQNLSVTESREDECQILSTQQQMALCQIHEGQIPVAKDEVS